MRLRACQSLFDNLLENLTSDYLGRGVLLRLAGDQVDRGETLEGLMWKGAAHESVGVGR